MAPSSIQESHEDGEIHPEKRPHLKKDEDDESEVAEEALGGPTTDFLPKGYYRSPNFVGTVVVSFEQIEICAKTVLIFLVGSLPGQLCVLPWMGSARKHFSFNQRGYR